MYMSFTPEQVISTCTIEELKQIAILAQAQLDYYLSIELTEEEKEHIKNKEIIQAIKALRFRTGIALRDAKNIVDSARGF